MTPPYLWPAGDVECLGVSPSVFFTDREGRWSTREPAAFCRRCKVQVLCLEWALENHEAGFWGGTTEKERQVIRRRRGLKAAA